MARLSRIVVVNTPHHVTQRGNARQFILASDAERMVYLELLQQYIEFHRLSLLGYCLLLFCFWKNNGKRPVCPQSSQSSQSSGGK